MRRLAQGPPLPAGPTQPSLTAVSPSGMCFDTSGQAVGAATFDAAGNLLPARVATIPRTWWWIGGGAIALLTLVSLSRRA